MNKAEITRWLKQRAWQLGFSQAATTPAVRPPGFDHLREWVESGYAGQMDYIGDRLDAYADPGRVLEGARSVLMLTLDYQTITSAKPQAGEGRVSRYAWSDADYHDGIHRRLKSLVKQITEQMPAANARGVVDSAPLMEREFAQLAGLGWIGKHTLLMNRWQGSYFFLAALLIDIELDYDTVPAVDHCGTCTACLDACPTAAFPQPGVLDATRCVSYLTIELDAPIPRELRAGIGDWLFGCDVCQDVCPWNQRAPVSITGEFNPRVNQNPIDLVELFDLDDEAFRQRFRRTPLWRAKRRGLLRNAAIVLGNKRAERALPALVKGLNDSESFVRGACAWALGKYNARDTLRERLAIEPNPTVCEEIEHSLSREIES